MLNLFLAGALMLAPTSTDLILSSQPAPLHGTLLVPEGPRRATAVIIAGSGPTDRNGDSPLGVRGGVLRQLAEGLAEDGIATLRYDKRGIAASAAAGSDEADLRFDSLIDDARAWAAEAAQQTGQTCVWLIGHSEGALIALGATRTPDDGICGLVLLSGAGHRADVVIAEQLAAVPEPLKSQALTALSDLSAGRTTASVPGLEALFRPSVQPYLISWFAMDPAALIAAYDGPVMIAQGTTDLQTSLDDARALKAVQPDAELVEWAGVNHVLKLAPLDRMPNLATYSDPDLSLAPAVVEDVAGFILKPR